VHPARAQASIMASHSASVMAIGFSTTTCLPASAAATVIGQCRWLGAAMVIISIDGSASRSW
jgi:hypothetical protein